MEPTGTLPQSGKREDRFSGLANERVIPLRFIQLVDGSAGCNTTIPDSLLAQRVREANEQWAVAGIQFAFASRATYTVPTTNGTSFAKLTTTSIACTFPPSGTSCWNPAWTASPCSSSDLGQIDPAICGFTPSTTTTTTPTGNDQWVTLVLKNLTPTQIPVIIPCSDSQVGHSQFPDYDTSTSPWLDDWSRGIHLEYSGTADDWTYSLPHELGHYLGLAHAFTYAGGQVDGTPDKSQGGDSSSFWDLLYLADASGNYVRTFTSASDVNGQPPSRQRNKEPPPSFSCSTSCCTSSSGNCDLACPWPGYTPSPGPTTSVNPNDLYGIGFNLPSDSPIYGTNLMGYLGTVAGCNDVLTGSQIAYAQHILRTTRGMRNSLGRYTDPLYPSRNGLNAYKELDFDGDGKFDIAYWSQTDKKCHYVGSSDNTAHTLSMAGVANPALGDIPVPTDYDGDGKTDCALWRPGGGAQWFWTRSAAGTDCPTSLSGCGTDSNWGTWGDVPLAGQNFKSSSGYPSLPYAVYRPSSANFYWKDTVGNQYGQQYGMTGDQLMLGNYDTDTYTDFAVWRPKYGATRSLFSVKTSVSNYSDSHDFGLDTSYTVGGVTYSQTDIPLLVNRWFNLDGGPHQDLAFWRESDGVWRYIHDPGLQTSNLTKTPDLTEQWGTTGDIPLAGFDIDGDGMSDPIVFRSAQAFNTPGNFYIALTGGGSPSITPQTNGLPGDLPFLTRPRQGFCGASFWTYRSRTATWFENYFTNATCSAAQFNSPAGTPFGTYKNETPL